MVGNDEQTVVRAAGEDTMDRRTGQVNADIRFFNSWFCPFGQAS